MMSILRYRLVTLVIIFGVFFNNLYVAGQKEFPLKPIDEKRVEEIAPLLSDTPSGLGKPCAEREYWNALLNTGKYDDFLKEMKSFSFPEFSEDDYFSLSRGASSSAQGLEMMRDRAKGLAKLTWAECLENKGGYLPAIEAALKDVLLQKSWVSPRNDFQFQNYYKKKYTVEITTAMYVHAIAQMIYLLGDKISPKLRSEAVEVMYERVFNPVLNTIRTLDVKMSLNFLMMDNNYNPVCLAGVVGAALAVIPDKKERAVFVHIGEYYSQNGLKGFNDDGYCTEGVMYYNYGFQNYIVLRHCIWQATNGKIDLFSDPKVSNIAWYAPKIEVINDVYPAISDCGLYEKPNYDMMCYLNRNLGMGLDKYNSPDAKISTTNLALSIMMAFRDSSVSPKTPSDKNRRITQNLRSFFEESSVLVSRPSDNGKSNMGVVFKGGNNGEAHNHNDVGSYTIIVNDKNICGDPGSIPYTADIFKKEFRYTYKTIGSYGHPVPLVAGKQQIPGEEAKAKLIDKQFTDDKDELLIDISSAYDEPTLSKLERRFVYDRTGKGKITITDNFRFSEENTYETAVISYGKWEKIDSRTICISMGNEKLYVRYTGSGSLTLKPETIKEGKMPYTRLGIQLDKKVKNGSVMLEFSSLM